MEVMVREDPLQKMRTLVQNELNLVLTLMPFGESHFRKVSHVIPNLAAVDQLDY